MVVYRPDRERGQGGARRRARRARARPRPDPRHGQEPVRNASPGVRACPAADDARRDSVRLASCGIVDVLTHDARQPQDLGMLQQEDLAAFGRLVFLLGCGHAGAVNNPQKALDTLGRHYSADVGNVALFLVSKPTPKKVRRLPVPRPARRCWLMESPEHLTAVRYAWDQAAHGDGRDAKVRLPRRAGNPWAKADLRIAVLWTGSRAS